MDKVEDVIEVESKALGEALEKKGIQGIPSEGDLYLLILNLLLILFSRMCMPKDSAKQLEYVYEYITSQRQFRVARISKVIRRQLRGLGKKYSKKVTTEVVNIILVRCQHMSMHQLRQFNNQLQDHTRT